ncbi:uncharacterized protein V6R79_013320 [Siganus canaliculatus]
MVSGKQGIQSRFGPSARKEKEEEEEEEEEEVSFFRNTRHPSSWVSQYEHIVRLSTPKTRSHSSQEVRPPHTPQCGKDCPMWHPRGKAALITLRLLQLSRPKVIHPDFQGNRQRVESSASRAAQMSQRLVQLSLPRLKESNICRELGRPEESIWTVPKAARRAMASAHVEMLATPKQLSKDYIPPRDPEWSPKSITWSS